MYGKYADLWNDLNTVRSSLDGEPSSDEVSFALLRIEELVARLDGEIQTASRWRSQRNVFPLLARQNLGELRGDLQQLTAPATAGIPSGERARALAQRTGGVLELLARAWS
jgi:hypothetical protein